MSCGVRHVQPSTMLQVCYRYVTGNIPEQRDAQKMLQGSWISRYLVSEDEDVHICARDMMNEAEGCGCCRQFPNSINTLHFLFSMKRWLYAYNH